MVAAHGRNAEGAVCHAEDPGGEQGFSRSFRLSLCKGAFWEQNAGVIAQGGEGFPVFADGQVHGVLPVAVIGYKARVVCVIVAALSSFRVSKDVRQINSSFNIGQICLKSMVYT